MTDLAATVDGTPQLVLPPVLDLTLVADIKRQLEEALARGAGIDIDASQVQRVTTPCLQLFAAAMKSFVQAGGPAMHFASLSSEFRETVTALGLETVLGIKGLQA
jgi:anti-anti-sigma regulatory factor